MEKVSGERGRQLNRRRSRRWEYLRPARRPDLRMTDRRSLPRITVVLSVLAVVAAACSSVPAATSTGAGSPTTTASSQPPRPSSAGAEPLPEVLDFSAPMLGGGTVGGSRYVGKDLAIWFWAPW